MILSRTASGVAFALGSFLFVAFSLPAEAARGGGHGGHQGGARAAARTSVNRPGGGGGGVNRNFNANGNINNNVNRNRNVDVNRNRNVNRNVNIDRDIDIDVDYHDHDHWNDWDDHPFARAAAVTAGVAVASAVIGSIVYSLPPSCVVTIVNGVSYQQCGGAWYMPRYCGTTVQYVVVDAPG